MYAEFVFPHEKPILDRFGLNCYGCCEPMNARWETVKQCQSKQVRGCCKNHHLLKYSALFAGLLLTASLPALATAGSDAKPFPLLNPPEGITPAQTREPFSWSFPEAKNPNPNPNVRLPRQTWTPEERRAYEKRVKWLHEARWGIFFHYISGGVWAPEEWNKWVDAVDVNKVADQAKKLGVGYVIITLGQHHQYFCAPNPVIDKFWGPQHTTKRDLPMDLYKALEKRGIPMMLYVAVGKKHKMPLPGSPKDGKRYECWLEALKWWSDHYGTKCKGWWVDGLFHDYIKDYRVNVHKVLKSGNPDALIASEQMEISDFLHGHCMDKWSRQSAVVKPFFGRWDPDFDIQWHVFQYIGRTWGAPGCNKKTEDLVQYSVDVIRGGGVITFDLGTFTEGCFHRLPPNCPTGKKSDGSRIGPFLEIQPDQFKVLEAVRDALKDVNPSEGSGGKQDEKD